MTALIRNDVQMVCLPAIAVMPQLGSGVLKVLAVSTAERSALLPNIPTLKEAGLDVEADALERPHRSGGHVPGNRGADRAVGRRRDSCG
jgi:tripartite-type tricarboxylate transporter receptor subunit TctC